MIKMSVLHKAACRFNAIPMKIAKAFFHRTRTNNLKIYIKPQKKFWITNTVLRKKIKVERYHSTW